MKYIKYIFIAIIAITIVACSDDFELNDNDQGLNVEILSGIYVAFETPGSNITLDPVEVDEDAGLLEDDITIEAPAGTLSNITINYSLGGTAVFGTDYTIDGATSTGGSIRLTPAPANDPENVIEHVDFPITILRDGVLDGEKTIIITLLSASNAEGKVLVGRGGTNLLNQATILISDIHSLAFASPPSITSTEVGIDSTLTLVASGGSQSDITANVSLSGTAELGVDFNIQGIDGLTSEGGTVTLSGSALDMNPSADIVIEYLSDGIADGEKTLDITLDSASNSDGAFNVADNKTVNITIIDTHNVSITNVNVNSIMNPIDFSVEPISVTENDLNPINILVEALGGSESDVTIDFTLSVAEGDEELKAVLGVDYTLENVDNLTDEGGSITLSGTSLDEVPNNIIVVKMLSDDVVDGEKRFILTLDNASNTDGDFTIDNNQVEIVITDSD